MTKFEEKVYLEVKKIQKGKVDSSILYNLWICNQGH